MNYLDDMIYRIYKELEIEVGNVLPHTVCAKLGVVLKYSFENSFHSQYLGDYYIVLDSSKTQQEQLYDFAHELGHFMLHAGNQFKSKQVYIDYQEKQAHNFAERFLVPFHALATVDYTKSRMEILYFVTQKFNVSKKLAKKRLELYERTLYEQKMQSYFW
ncbi:ImmA/IrrE family metallo-endopeptidase [Listeria monocytogenes]|nr:ImmA/IrrE family metallo-endopeptidase [Listeria monocytogenes]EAD0383095.1 ImmA/IrrE family metallo-endopeptidase [Listeria monocytogenes]EAD9128469.1 ImmA/IrrE family metallo-endopeptidase [Listeria monocytogenes]EAE9170618.1 ImmA/IrrE family metallo-endopeptidase [Listeria monocytogenes]EAF2023438.1 ImmA/IrrE family metallo-endopeptidase [Listeria monocytogenes]